MKHDLKLCCTAQKPLGVQIGSVYLHFEQRGTRAVLASSNFSVLNAARLGCVAAAKLSSSAGSLTCSAVDCRCFAFNSPFLFQKMKLLEIECLLF